MNNKNKKWLILILLICILLGIIIFRPKSSLTPPTGLQNNTEVVEEETALTPPTADENLPPVSVTIVSPEEETFSPSQARLWKAQVHNYVSEFGQLASCEWRFYLNENNEEVLYREQETSAILSTGGDNTCAFTDTFIDRQGKLRAEVTVHVKDMQDNILETFVAERNYVVR